MQFALFALCYFILLIAIINFFTIRTPRNSARISNSVTVLLPMRNEQDNAADCVAGLMAQKNLDQIQVIIINDQSTDNTAEVLSKAIGSDSRFSVITTQGPQEGWLGKVFALQNGFQLSKGEIIICLDADVRLQPEAIARSVNQLEELSLDFISPYPHQIANTVTEKLIQPLLHWSWLSTVPLRYAEKSGRVAFAVANGQFFAVKKEALQKSGGYSSIKSEVLDDMQMARVLLRHKFKGTVGNGALIAQCHMYSSWNELRNGYAKSLWKGFGGIFGSFVAIALLVLTGIIPIISAATGSPYGWLAFEAVLVSRVLSAKITRSNIFDSLLHPISATLLIYLIIYSWLMRGRIQWKGRTV